MEKERLIALIAEHILYLDERGGGPEGVYYTTSKRTPGCIVDQEYMFSELEDLIKKWDNKILE